eukprot:TRINITY_DN23576_c0_g1_i1.p1 TRINITY_DN23576_c0_g1~~TRINITY_DN23576_c0_g1_i1.p1  ORF type:complete len:870 (+),score=103.80 TRINITY_DN23576_c0_g1_i1:37-2646(+)
MALLNPKSPLPQTRSGSDVPNPHPAAVGSRAIPGHLRAASTGSFRDAAARLPLSLQVSTVTREGVASLSTPSTPVGSSAGAVKEYISLGLSSQTVLPSTPGGSAGGSRNEGATVLASAPSATAALRQDLYALQPATQRASSSRLSLPPSHVPGAVGLGATIESSSSTSSSTAMMRSMSPDILANGRFSGNPGHVAAASPSASARMTQASASTAADRLVTLGDEEIGIEQAPAPTLKFSHKPRMQSYSQDPVAVCVNIYHQTQVAYDENGRRVKTLTEGLPEVVRDGWKDMAGIYHIGVEIDGREFCYGIFSNPKGEKVGPADSGIICHSPRFPGPGNKWRAAEPMGTTKCSPGQVIDILVDLANQNFKKALYSRYDNNCVDFARAFCQRLHVGAEIPAWCTRALDGYRMFRTVGTMLGGAWEDDSSSQKKEEEEKDKAAVNGREGTPAESTLDSMMTNGVTGSLGSDSALRAAELSPTAMSPAAMSPTAGAFGAWIPDGPEVGGRLSRRSRASGATGPRARTLSPSPISNDMFAQPNSLPSGIATLGGGEASAMSPPSIPAGVATLDVGGVSMAPSIDPLSRSLATLGGVRGHGGNVQQPVFSSTGGTSPRRRVLVSRGTVVLAGNVVSEASDGTFAVMYDNETVESGIPSSRLQPAAPGAYAPPVPRQMSAQAFGSTWGRSRQQSQVSIQLQQHVQPSLYIRQPRISVAPDETSPVHRLGPPRSRMSSFVAPAGVETSPTQRLASGRSLRHGGSFVAPAGSLSDEGQTLPVPVQSSRPAFRASLSPPQQTLQGINTIGSSAPASAPPVRPMVTTPPSFVPWVHTHSAGPSVPSSQHVQHLRVPLKVQHHQPPPQMASGYRDPLGATWR